MTIIFLFSTSDFILNFLFQNFQLLVAGSFCCDYDNNDDDDDDDIDNDDVDFVIVIVFINYVATSEKLVESADDVNKILWC